MSPSDDEKNLFSIGFLAKQFVDNERLRCGIKGFSNVQAISVHDAALVLDNLIDDVCTENGQPIEITREHQPSVVLMGKQEYTDLLKALEHTLVSSS